MFIIMQDVACTTLQMVYFIDYILYYLFTRAYSIFPVNSIAQYIFVKFI